MRGIDDAAWTSTDRPIQGARKLLRVLGVPRDAATFLFCGPGHEQFQDIREAASVLRDVLGRFELTDALIFTEWFYEVEFRGEAASRWLDESVYEHGWWDQKVAWFGPGTLRAAYDVDIHDYEALFLTSWGEEGRELLDSIREALVPLPRIPGGFEDGWTWRRARP